MTDCCVTANIVSTYCNDSEDIPQCTWKLSIQENHINMY